MEWTFIQDFFSRKIRFCSHPLCRPILTDF
jgi:hypothetical protein